jgi:hypothetical protein
MSVKKKKKKNFPSSRIRMSVKRKKKKQTFSECMHACFKQLESL